MHRLIQKNAQVQFNSGPLEGLRGVAIARRERGRFLVEISRGIYVEIQETYLQAVEERRVDQDIA